MTRKEKIIKILVTVLRELCGCSDEQAIVILEDAKSKFRSRERRKNEKRQKPEVSR